MNLSEMRAKFHKHTSSLADDFAPNEVDGYLNRAFRYTVPHDVGGEFGEYLYTLTLEVGKRIYDQPPWLIGFRPERTPWISGDTVQGNYSTIQYVNADTDPNGFLGRTSGREATTGRPIRMLIYGKEIVFDRIPDKEYYVNFQSRAGEPAALPNEGIDHEIHALAVVEAAAVEFLIESEDTEGVQREATIYERHVNQLHTYAQARPERRRFARSF